ncbi:MAG: hypothetical protein KC492_41215, partial [Myxococcales bacterium]|nr:hypothetical protein [Myxococcales bacterium]
MRCLASVLGLLLLGCVGTQAPGGSVAPVSSEPSPSPVPSAAPSVSTGKQLEQLRLPPARKESYCPWRGVESDEVDAANQELLLNGAERARALATHLPFGEPPPRTEHQRLRVLKQ